MRKEVEDNKILFVNFILKRTDKYTKETKVLMFPISSSIKFIDDAHKQIELMRKSKDFDVVSAWIVSFDTINGETKTIFHDFYVDFVGNIEKIKEN